VAYAIAEHMVLWRSRARGRARSDR
jgi:hypothetical protein